VSDLIPGEGSPAASSWFTYRRGCTDGQRRPPIVRIFFIALGRPLDFTLFFLDLSDLRLRFPVTTLFLE